VKALSIGAKIVSPFPELLSWLSICCATAVDLRRRMNVLNCPALASTPVMFVVDPAVGAGAAGVGVAGVAVGACCADVTMMATENTMRRSTGFFMVSLPVIYRYRSACEYCDSLCTQASNQSNATHSVSQTVSREGCDAATYNEVHGWVEK
jgi:hypothetical protein